MQKFNWIKKGLVFKANGQYDWMYCYTSPLTGFFVDDNRYRIYFSTRAKPDAEGNFICRISYVEVDVRNPKQILYVHDRPVLEVGGLGTFDENGTMVAEIVKYKDKIYMYYMGWQRALSVPYNITLGLAISDDNGITFKKVSAGPVIGFSKDVPYGIGNVSVLISGDYDWHMWYTHFTGWTKKGNTFNPNYFLKYAKSRNGVDWIFPNIDCVRPSFVGENIATPCVVRIGDKYHMWFSTRKDFGDSGGKGGYIIGYAYSNDMINWTRNDELGGMYPTGTGWDSEMVCYPHVVVLSDKIYMFYCGNRYGEGGFGYAEINTAK